MKDLVQTRFKTIFYKKQSAKMWNIFVVEEGSYGPAWIGPHYASKTELLADLERIVNERGYN